MTVRASSTQKPFPAHRNCQFRKPEIGPKSSRRIDQEINKLGKSI